MSDPIEPIVIVYNLCNRHWLLLNHMTVLVETEEQDENK